MAKFDRFIAWRIIGLLCLAVQPATAQSVSKVTTTPILRVNDWSQPATSVREWLTQATPPTDIVQITGVILNPTQDGLEIILETGGGETLQGTTLIREDSLITEILDLLQIRNV